MPPGVELISSYFPDLSERQLSQLAQLQDLYSYWNQRINVISRKDIDQLYERHVLHSLAIAKFITFQPGAKILDIGTGGGFPGIPLAILFPSVAFNLVDSIGKKIKVVQEVSKALELQNVTGVHQRAESAEGPFDFVVTRAVARSAKLYQWCRHALAKESKHEKPNGIICLKGGDLTEELQELKRPSEVTPLKEFFNEEFFDTKVIVYIPR